MGLLQRRRGLMSAKKQQSEIFLNTPKYYKAKQVTTSGSASQGGCFVKSGDYEYIYFMTVASGNTTQYLYSFSLNDGTLTLRETYTTLGHANSMTYNPDDSVFYVATDTTNGIAVIKLSDYSIDSFIPLYKADGTTVTSPWSIAYDRNKHLLYSQNNVYGVYVYDTSGTYVDYIEFDQPPQHTAAQSMETDGDYLYFVMVNPNYVEVYTIGGEYVTTQTVGFSAELEEICFDWNGRFYATAYEGSSGRQGIYSLLLRSFDQQMQLAYVPQVAWDKSATGGSVGCWGNYSFTLKSTAAASWKIKVYSAGVPYGYSELVGKKCKVSFELKRTAGSAGQISLDVFTTNTQTPTAASDMIYSKSPSYQIPASGSITCEYEFTPGVDKFLPAEGQEGTYLGFRFFLYAANGNQCYLKSFRFTAEA